MQTRLLYDTKKPCLHNGQDEVRVAGMHEKPVSYLIFNTFPYFRQHHGIHFSAIMRGWKIHFSYKSSKQKIHFSAVFGVWKPHFSIFRPHGEGFATPQKAHQCRRNKFFTPSETPSFANNAYLCTTKKNFYQ